MSLGFLLNFLVLFHLLPCLSAQEYVNSSSNSICPNDFECPKIGPMSFPFANFTQPDCGLCMVDCLAQPLPTIKLSSSSVQPFQVKRKLQSNVLKLHDPTFQNLLRQNYSSCFLFYYSTRIPNSSSISFTIKSNITLFRCSKSSKLLPEVIDYFSTNQFKRNETCQEFDIYYKNPKTCNYSLEDKPFLPGCSVLHLPVWENASEDTELLQWLTADFDLEWHLSDRCYYDCHLKGGKCETVETNEFHCANYPKGIGSLAQGGKGNLEKKFNAYHYSYKLWFFPLVSIVLYHWLIYFDLKCREEKKSKDHSLHW